MCEFIHRGNYHHLIPDNLVPSVKRQIYSDDKAILYKKFYLLMFMMLNNQP